ncbi:MAG: replication-associated recombination protein A [Gemmatimonadota bacterium]|nr:replication-associated recombination protein A [Gemmatimonadota bacterium]MDH3422716.1 replication-associated recombination protein A [Gemmatimonadota bacterium]
MRPRTLEEFRGQDHLLGTGKAIRAMLDAGEPGSMIFWGPPGSGKTTLARLVAGATETTFVALSAVTEGIARVREIIGEADQRLRATGRRTILFCDEIHRFNKAQQDAFLPHVERGTVILIGATTENPSFEVVRPLLSRAPVYVLSALTAADLHSILEDALADAERGLAADGLAVDPAALDFMSVASDGDARRALGVLEAAARLVGPGGRIDIDAAKEALQHRFATYDKGGEEHYNVISALHKSVRGSDPDASLYWLARMIEGGEDPLYIVRRLVRMASEDIGLADPEALRVTLAARDAYHFLGSPEGELAIAEAVLYLATAPKSNRTYEAWGAALAKARDTPSAPVPLHIRNAPTDLMKGLGYGAGYRYDPHETDGIADQEYLPESLGGTVFYRPGPYGREKRIAERMEWWAARRRTATEESSAAESEVGSRPDEA